MAEYEDYTHEFGMRVAIPDDEACNKSTPVHPRDSAWNKFCRLSDELEQLRSADRDLIRRLKEVSKAREEARQQVLGYIDPEVNEGSA